MKGRLVDFLLDYFGFLLRAVTVLAVVLVVLAALAALRNRNRKAGDGELDVVKLNDRYKQMAHQLQHALLDRHQLKALRKAEAKQEKSRKKEAKDRPRVFVLDFDGDIKASAADPLAQEVTALLELAKPTDEVVLRLESGGGIVNGYGLAASQLARIRAAGVPLTVCVDKVAASGGYLMACVGQRILSAPFALIGSIGVVAQLPNVHRLLKRHDVDFEVVTAGKYKRTLTLFGENTEQGREKFKQDLEDIHGLFKEFVSRYRPQLLVDEVATGEVWLGEAALNKHLVDELKTSDEYLAERAKQAELFQLRYVQKRNLAQRIGVGTSLALDRVVLSWLTRLLQQRFW